jgi:acyl dehydratase
MTETAPAPGLYFEDLRVGHRYTSGRYSVSEAQILAFAREFDPQPLHLDPVAARESTLGGLSASGWHTAAITMRLTADGPLQLAGGTVGLGAELRWHKPTRPGDVLHLESEIVELRLSRSNPDRGVVRVRMETRTEAGVLLQTLVATLLVPTRPTQAKG